MNRKTDAEILEALKKAQGFYTLAAKALGINRRTIAERVAKSAKLKKALNDEMETRLDLAENRLVAAVNNGERWAIKFLLECKGRDRGYCKRLEIEDKTPRREAVRYTREELIGLALGKTPNGVLGNGGSQG